MSDDTTPIGQRYSHVYMKRGEPQQDSQRMRRRLAELIGYFGDLDEEFPRTLTSELGIDVPAHAGVMGGANWPKFLRDCELQDLLDFITLAYRYLVARTGARFSPASNWCQQVQRIFVEENVHYSVDQQGGVHFRFDEEFEHNRAATIASVQGPRYRAALTEFEKGMAAPRQGAA